MILSGIQQIDIVKTIGIDWVNIIATFLSVIVGSILGYLCTRIHYEYQKSDKTYKEILECLEKRTHFVYDEYLFFLKQNRTLLHTKIDINDISFKEKIYDLTEMLSKNKTDLKILIGYIDSKISGLNSCKNKTELLNVFKSLNVFYLSVCDFYYEYLDILDKFLDDVDVTKINIYIKNISKEIESKYIDGLKSIYFYN